MTETMTDENDIERWRRIARFDTAQDPRKALLEAASEVERLRAEIEAHEKTTAYFRERCDEALTALYKASLERDEARAALTKE